jgi:diguanylate cyclase (GGDEF)-like protein/PAS domain S-box-containing protein
MNIGRFIRRYFSLLTLLSIVTGLLFWVLHYQALNAVEIRLKYESNTLINQLITQLNMKFLEIHSDLRLLTEQYIHQRLAIDQDKQHSFQSLEQLWSSMAAQKGRYDQIRFLNLDGQEVIRVNYNNGAPAPVRRNLLQSKKHRYYFPESIKVPPGSIWSSPLDLNIENHQIELPLKPTIRFATPVYMDKEGKVIGIVIVNYLAKELLDEFRRISASFSGNALLLNWRGYSLLSPDSDQDWSFMFPDSPQTTIRIKHYKAWQTMQRQGRGQELNQQGLYTFGQLNPTGSIEINKNCRNCLRVLLHIPNQQIQAVLWRDLSQTMPALLLGYIVLAIILGLALWLREKQVDEEHQIANLNRKISYEHELFLNGPEVFAKLRNQLGWPIEFISSNVEELLGYPSDHFQPGKITFSSIIDTDYLPRYSRETEQADQNRITTFKRAPYQVIDHAGCRKWVQETTHLIRSEQGELTHFFVHISDVSALKEAEKQLTQSHDYIQKVVDTIPDPTMVIDINTYHIQLLNQSALKLYNQGKQIQQEMSCYRLSHKRNNPCEGARDPCPLKEIIEHKIPVSVIHKHYDHHGNVMHVDVRATPIFDESGENVIQIIESHRDITATVEMEKKLQHIAQTDRLTQVFNRLKFDEELKNMIAWASLTHNYFGLIMLDLDHFKKVNDTYGHDVGDQVLKNTVKLLRKRIRKSDILARWGGEEFMIITPSTDKDELSILGESLRLAIEQHEHIGVGKVTASLGASVASSSDNIESLIKRVDLALYESKQNGRNLCTLL